MEQQAKSQDVAVASIEKGASAGQQAQGGGVFTVTCLDKDGNVKWTAKSHNLVVNEGLKDMNEKYLTGAAYTAAWYLGLYGAAAASTPAAGDTMSSHAGWVEVTPYSESTRQQCVFGTSTLASPSVISNSASPALFSINSTATVGGAFLTNNNVKGGTTGILFSAADFGAPGDRAVVSGDTLTVTYTFNLSAA